MTSSSKTIRPATPKQSIIIMLIGLIISLSLIFMIAAGDFVLRKFESELTDKECTVVDIYTEVDVRNENMYTIFRDGSGNEYKKRTTMNDHIGRKAVLSIHGASAYRNSLEFMRPSDVPTWVICFMPVYLFIGLIYYVFKAIRLGLDGTRGSAQTEY